AMVPDSPGSQLGPEPNWRERRRKDTWWILTTFLVLCLMVFLGRSFYHLAIVYLFDPGDAIANK
ncbi:hypothetical protein V4Y02_24280, partial [Escherichia coli]